MVYNSSVCVRSVSGTASVSPAEHNIQFDSCHHNLNDLWRLSCRQPFRCFMVTHGWNAAILRGLRARKSSHKEFSFLLVAIKCLSAFLLCTIPAKGYWMYFLSSQEETVALRKEGSRVVVDCQLPHLIGIDEDLLGAGINLYYLKVNGSFENLNLNSTELGFCVMIF